MCGLRQKEKGKCYEPYFIHFLYTLSPLISQDFKAAMGQWLEDA